MFVISIAWERAVITVSCENLSYAEQTIEKK